MSRPAVCGSHLETVKTPSAVSRASTHSGPTTPKTRHLAVHFSEKGTGPGQWTQVPEAAELRGVRVGVRPRVWQGALSPASCVLSCWPAGQPPCPCPVLVPDWALPTGPMVRACWPPLSSARLHGRRPPGPGPPGLSVGCCRSPRWLSGAGREAAAPDCLQLFPGVRRPGPTRCPPPARPSRLCCSR